LSTKKIVKEFDDSFFKREKISIKSCLFFLQSIFKFTGNLISIQCREFINSCLRKNPSLRPTADQLAKLDFIENYGLKEKEDIINPVSIN
jgi:hypothetical protein